MLSGICRSPRRLQAGEWASLGAIHRPFGVERAARTTYAASVKATRFNVVAVLTVALWIHVGWNAAAQQQPPASPGEIAELLAKAEQGDAAAQFKLGFRYSNGQDVPKNEAAAVRWYYKAAEQGLAAAQNNLGAAFASGRGVAKDDSEAVKWYRKAAEQGHAYAQSNLGEMYRRGNGIPKDLIEAVKWSRKAAEQGHSWAQMNLASMYASGEGMPKDDAEALRWYRNAAEQGEMYAQYETGWRYEQGQGESRDLAEAYKWWLLAGAQGMDDAKEAYSKLERKLTPKQRADGQHRAREFKPRRGPTTLSLGPAPAVLAAQPGSSQGTPPPPDLREPVEYWLMATAAVCAVVFALLMRAHLRQRGNLGTATTPSHTMSAQPAPTASPALYVILAGNTHGPLTEAQVLDMVRQGQLLGETPAWKEGLADWKRLDQLVSLLSAQTAQMPLIRAVTSINAMPPPPQGFQTAPTSQVPLAPLPNQAERGFGFLRCVRGICGFLFAMQIVGLLPVLMWFQQPSVITGDMVAILLIQGITKVTALGVFGWLFFWLRKYINQLHTTVYGVPHPGLANKWAV